MLIDEDIKDESQIVQNMIKKMSWRAVIKEVEKTDLFGDEIYHVKFSLYDENENIVESSIEISGELSKIESMIRYRSMLIRKNREAVGNVRVGKILYV